MVQYLEPVIEEVIVPTEGNEGATITRLNQANGVNNVIPGLPGPPPLPGTGRNLLWHTKVWKAIFGVGNSHPNPNKLTQAQTNQLVAQSLGNILAALASVTDAVNNAVQELSTQITTDIPSVISLIGSDVAGLAQQINALSKGIGTASNAAIVAAVQQAEAHSDAVARNVATQLGNQIQQTVGEIHHEAAARSAGDAATLAKADANAVAYADFIGSNANHRMDGLQATEKSDVLNLNHRIDSVQTTVEGDIAKGVANAEGYATGLVNDLNVPGLRNDVNTLAQTVAKVAAEADQCLTPLCDTVTPNAKQLGNLGGLLKTLEGVGVAALLAGLVAEAINDPHTAADAIVTAGGWVDDVAVTLAQDVGG